MSADRPKWRTLAPGCYQHPAGLLVFRIDRRVVATIATAKGPRTVKQHQTAWGLLGSRHTFPTRAAAMRAATSFQALENEACAP
ncbi:MAG: hypothetical protein V4739_04700 [Pseudomonadota bacterium]